MQRAFIETHPSVRSVYFLGHFVHLTEVSRQNHLDHGYLYKVISGQRVPSVGYLIALAKIFDVTVDELLAAIEERRLELEAKVEGVLSGLDWSSPLT